MAACFAVSPCADGPGLGVSTTAPPRPPAPVPAVALFATAWPYESDCGPGAPACWQRRDARFWRRIQRARRAGQSPACSARPLARQLPLRSDFCVGSGRALYQGGRLIRGRPWYNLSLQSLQPTLRVRWGAGSSPGGSTANSPRSSSGSPRRGSRLEAELCQAGPAFSGSSTVRLSGCLPPGQLAAVELYPAAAQPLPGALSVRLTSRGGAGVHARLALRLAAGSSGEGGTLELQLELGNPAGPAAADGWSAGQPVVHCAGSCDRIAGQVAAAPEGAEASTAAAAAGAADIDWLTWHWRISPADLARCMPPASGSGAPVMALSSVEVLLRGTSSSGGFELHLGGWVAGQQPAAAWIGMPAAQSVGSVPAPPAGEICVEAAPASGLPAGPASVQQLTCSSLQLSAAGAAAVEAALADAEEAGTGSRQVAARLSWVPPPGDAIRCCHVWWCSHTSAAAAGTQEACQWQWLGAAFADGFWVAGLAVPPGAAQLVFVVQPEGCNGLAQELAAAARVTASLPAVGAESHIAVLRLAA